MSTKRVEESRWHKPFFTYCRHYGPPGPPGPDEMNPDPDPEDPDPDVATTPGTTHTEHRVVLFPDSGVSSIEHRPVNLLSPGRDQVLQTSVMLRP